MTDWAKLKDHKGSAKSVPTWVKRLGDADPEKVNDAYQALDDALVRPEAWCTAAGPALELLFAQLPRMKTEIGVVLLLVADILGARHRNALRRDAKRPPKKVVGVVEAHLPELEALAGSKDENARAGFAQVAATVPELADKTRGTLSKLLADREPTVRMSALLALGAVGGRDDLPAIRSAARDKDGGVRGAATIAEIALDPKVKLAQRSEGIESWLSFERPKWSAKGPQFLWFPVHGGTDLLGPLMDLAKARKAVPDVLGALMSRPGSAHKAVSELVLAEGGFIKAFTRDEPEGYVALVDELDKKQRALAEKLADSDLVPVGAFGLPACGAPRRRWLGLDPPGPSDAMVDVTVEKKRYKGPFWRVVQDMIRADVTPWGIYPRALEGVHGDLERWEAMVDKAAQSYGGPGVDYDEVEAELARVDKEPRLLDRAEAIAADLARRFRAARGYEWLGGPQHARSSLSVPSELDAQATALLLLPLVRNKRTWPEEWDVILSRDENDLMEAVAAGLPAKRRKALAESSDA